MSGVSPVINSSEVYPCSIPACMAVNLHNRGNVWVYLHSRLRQYVINIYQYHFLRISQITTSAGFWLEPSLSDVCPWMPYFLKLD